MWSTDRFRVAAALLACAGLATACAGDPSAGARGPISNGRVADSPTPLDHYPLATAEKTQEVALAVHPQGALSPAQQAALAGLAQAWLDAGGPSPLVVQHPASAGPDALLTARAVAGQLTASGVPADALRLGAYEGPGPGAPVLARFARLDVVPPDCNRGWDNLVSTKDNGVSTHFGCATAHNVAVMLADPRDLQAPRPMDAPDASRRAAVLDSYRKGAVTSSAKDAGASGSISQAVH